MSETKLSERAQKILSCLTPPTQFLRQQTLAEQFNCSRRTIGRALTELKNAGLLVDLNKRHENRCKIYQVTESWIATSATPPRNEEHTLQGMQQLKLYRQTFEANFRDWPDWEKYYPQVTWELRHETNMDLIFRQTFDRLYVIRDSQIE